MRHFMGTSTFAEYTVMPEIALAKVTGCSARRLRAVRMRARNGNRRSALHGERPGARRARCSVAASSGSGRSSARGSRARTDHRDRPLGGAPRDGAAPRRDRHAHCGDGVVDWIREETGGYGADYTFEATGNVAVMRQAVEAAREAWGLATMIGVAGKGETLDVIPRLLITGRRVTGSSFGGVGADAGAATRRPLARR